VAAGFGFVGIAGTLATPTNGVAIREARPAMSLMQEITTAPRCPVSNCYRKCTKELDLSQRTCHCVCKQADGKKTILW
jgi:hypothetical protein